MLVLSVHHQTIEQCHATANDSAQFAVTTKQADVARAVGLCRTIGDRIILAGLNFTIGTGEFISLLGANGAGKSTLVRIMATLAQPTQGDLYLFGHNCKSQLVNVRRRIGLIGHGAMLYRDLTAQENLIFFGKLYGVGNPARRADELLDWIKLSNRRDDVVKSFSRGMTQRVAIARALMHEPDLLLADEPFAGLDAPSTTMVEQMLATLHAQGKSIVLATHDLAQALSLTERTLVLREGQLIIDQPNSALTTHALLREISGTEEAAHS